MQIQQRHEYVPSSFAVSVLTSAIRSHSALPLGSRSCRQGPRSECLFSHNPSCTLSLQIAELSAGSPLLLLILSNEVSHGRAALKVGCMGVGQGRPAGWLMLKVGCMGRVGSASREGRMHGQGGGRQGNGLLGATTCICSDCKCFIKQGGGEAFVYAHNTNPFLPAVLSPFRISKRCWLEPQIPPHCSSLALSRP